MPKPMLQSGGPRPPFKLTTDEVLLIKLLREKRHQEVTVKVKDGVFVLVERKERFIRQGKGLTP